MSGTVPKRMVGSVNFDVYADPTTTNNPKQLSYSDSRTFSKSDLTDFNSMDRQLDPSSITSVDFGFTAKYLFMFVDLPVTIKLNGGTESFTINEALTLFGDFTEVEITNISATDTVCAKIGYGK